MHFQLKLKDLLLKYVILSDGTRQQVFEKVAKKQIYQCTICELTLTVGSLQSHIEGKKHQKGLRQFLSLPQDPNNNNPVPKAGPPPAKKIKVELQSPPTKQPALNQQQTKTTVAPTKTSVPVKPKLSVPQTQQQPSVVIAPANLKVTAVPLNALQAANPFAIKAQPIPDQKPTPPVKIVAKQPQKTVVAAVPVKTIPPVVNPVAVPIVQEKQKPPVKTIACAAITVKQTQKPVVIKPELIDLTTTSPVKKQPSQLTTTIPLLLSVEPRVKEDKENLPQLPPAKAEQKQNNKNKVTVFSISANIDRPDFVDKPSVRRRITGPSIMDAELFLDLSAHVGQSFVGLEYLVELQKYDTEPRYHCVLCDKNGDPRTIIIHMTSTTHRIKYFDKHYPSVMKELGELRYDKEARVAVIKVLEEVSAAVEKYHGRTKPVVVNMDHYQAERMRYLQQIMAGKHFSEFVGPSFVQLVDKKKIANITRTVKLKADVQRTVAEVEAANWGRERDGRRRSRSRSKSPARNRGSYDRRPQSPGRSSAREDPEKMEKYR